MSFFEDLPQAPEPSEDDEIEHAMPEWFGPPQQVMGAIVPLAQVVLRTEHVFIGLRSLTAHRSGLSIDVALAVRRAGMTRGRWREVEDAAWGHHHRPGASAAGAGGLRWGVELADGRRTSTLNRVDWRPEVVPSPPVLVDNDGSGSGGSRMIERSSALWLWPMPEGDAVSLVVQWPDLEVPVTTCRLDLGPVRAAVEHVVAFWP